MSTLTSTYRPHTIRFALVIKLENFIEQHTPRRCMLISLSMILAGLSIPILMVVHLLPVTFLFDFLGLALVSSGGVSALIHSGEI
jgi:hypothetical protein